MKLHVAMLYHSLVSDWNHGNAHFLRGIAVELQSRGHRVSIFEPEDSWSRINLIREHGSAAIDSFHRAFPTLTSTQYQKDSFDLNHLLDNPDLILVHEWNDPSVIHAAGEYRRRHPACRVLFHDTHHRAVTSPDDLSRLDLSAYDGVLAYGASLKQAYERRGWGHQVYVWHEAADTRLFHPLPNREKIGDVVWIGNWGDEERSQELKEFFIQPVKDARLRAHAYGVRYPEYAIHELDAASIAFGGWQPNFAVPGIFAQFRATIHIPRRPYLRALPGIPTIRPFEALACGIPLISAPWDDTEGLFRTGRDYLLAKNGIEMGRCLQNVIHDFALAASLVQHGLETIRARHTCAHRVDELMGIYRQICPAIHEQSNRYCGAQA